MIPNMTDTIGQAHAISMMSPAKRAIFTSTPKTFPNAPEPEARWGGGVYDGFDGGVCTTVCRLGAVDVVLIGGFLVLGLTVNLEEDADREVGLCWGLAFFLGGAKEFPHLGHSFKPSSL